MLCVWSLVFFGIMAAAKLGGNSSCTRSNSQADKGKLHEQKPLHEVFCVAGMMLQIDISVWVLQKPEELCNVEWGVPKTISFRKKVPRIISKWSELGWFPRQYCQCSSSRSMFHVSPPQKTAQHQMVQYKLSWRFNGDQWYWMRKFTVAAGISNHAWKSITSRYASYLHTILVYDSSFIINIFYLWLLETDSITSGSLRKLPRSNVGHWQTTMFSCARIFQPMLQRPQEKRVFAELLKKDSESYSAIHKLAPPPPPPPGEACLCYGLLDFCPQSKRVPQWKYGSCSRKTVKAIQHHSISTRIKN